MNYKPVHIVIDLDNVLLPETDLIAPMWYSVDIYDGHDRYEESLRPFTPEQRMLFALSWLDAEVNNGGFDQFFDNSTGIVWKDARAGFAAIGCQELVDCLDEAVRRMGGDIPFDRAARQARLEETEAEFDDLDDRYYDTDFADLVTAYVAAHPEAFCFDGTVMMPDYN